MPGGQGLDRALPRLMASALDCLLPTSLKITGLFMDQNFRNLLSSFPSVGKT